MPMQAERGGGGRLIIPTHSQLGTRKRWMTRKTPRQLYPLERPGTYCTGR